MEIDWQDKLSELSKELEECEIKYKVLNVMKQYDRRNKVKKEQLELIMNLCVENHEQFVSVHNNGLACTVQSLVYAVQENLVTTVQALVKNYSWLVNAYDANGNTPLHVALKLGNEQIVEILLRASVDLEAVDREGNTFLHLAAQSNLEKSFSNLELLCSKYKIFQKNIHNNNCIHVALRNGSDKVFESIYKQYIRFDYENLGFNNNSYLHFAAIGGCSKEIMETFISNTSDINCINLFGRTPLHEALLNGNKKAAHMLFEAGADITLVGIYNENCFHFAAKGNCNKMIGILNDIKDKINDKSKLGLTPLLVALQESAETTVETFITNDANLNALDIKGNSIFHYIAKRNFAELIHYLPAESPLLYQQNNAGYTPLHVSIKNNSYAVFKKFIKSKKGINTYCWKTKNTPLHTAAILGNWCYVYGLLLNGANPDARNDQGLTPIQLALIHKHLACVEILLLPNYSTNIYRHTCKAGFTVMHYAAKCTADIMDKIINANDRCFFDTINDITKDTLYHSAIRDNNLQTVQALVKCGVPQKENEDGVFPLHIAGKCNDPKIFEAVLEKLVDSDLTKKTKKGKSVLEYIASSGNNVILEMFKARLAYFNLPLEWGPRKNQKNVLHYAVKRGHLDIIHNLLSDENLCQIIDDLDDDGFAPLHRAVKFGNLKAVECLISFGCNKEVRTRRKDLKTPLHIAVINNQFEIVKYLVKIGVNVNMSDDESYTALHLAIVHGYEDILIYLIQNHASTKMITYKRKFTPLLLAIISNQVNMIKYLMQCDITLNTVADYISTFLRAAATVSGSHDALEYLKNWEGPDYNIIKLLSQDADEML